MEYKLVSFAAAVTALWTLVTLLLKPIRTLLKWKYIHDKNYTILAATLGRRSYFVKMFRPGYPDWIVCIRKSCSGYPEISVANNEISVTGPAQLLIWTHQKFYEGIRGEARSCKPSLPNLPGLIWGGAKNELRCFVWRACPSRTILHNNAMTSKASKSLSLNYSRF